MSPFIGSNASPGIQHTGQRLKFRPESRTPTVHQMRFIDDNRAQITLLGRPGERYPQRLYDRLWGSK
jgi:hypothetical protein